MAAQPCWPCRRKPRGNAGDRLNSRLASALSSASFHPGNCDRRNIPKRSRKTRRAQRRPASTPAGRPISSRNSGPSLRPNRSTTSSRRAADSRLMPIIRRVRLRVVSQASIVRREPRNPSAKLPVSSVNSSSPGSSSAGWRQLARKPSIELRISAALRPSNAGRGAWERDSLSLTKNCVAGCYPVPRC